MQICADTVVGDAMLRGVSGGQKKRVTTAESESLDPCLCGQLVANCSADGMSIAVVVGPKKTLFLDEISTGLVRVVAPGHTVYSWPCTAEARHHKLACWNSDMRALQDSSTTYQITKALRDFCHLREVTYRTNQAHHTCMQLIGHSLQEQESMTLVCVCRPPY